jgi:hypothetical protein
MKFIYQGEEYPRRTKTEDDYEELEVIIPEMNDEYFLARIDSAGNYKLLETISSDEVEINANPLDAQVSLAEPNQQLFTIAEVTDLLEEQKSICARESKVRYIHKKANLDKQAKIFRDAHFEQSWTTDERTIVNAPPPQKFIDKIVVKS